jgi:hypothetical protein
MDVHMPSAFANNDLTPAGSACRCRRPGRRTVSAARACALAAAAALLSAATPAGAYEARGHPWPTEVITYTTETPAYSDSVDRAARMLNRAGIGVRLRRSSRADLVFVYRGRACDGAARLGYQPRRVSTVWLGRGCGADLITLTAVHELGHVLGLDHENDRCARMNPGFDSTGTPNRCRRRPLSYWLANPLTADDLRGLRALY